MNKLIPIIIAVAVVIGGGAFYGGMKYSENIRPNSVLRNFNRQDLSANAGARLSGGQGFRGVFVNGQSGGGFINGEIIAKDDKSITLKLSGGGSRIIFFSDATEITKSAKGSVDDFKTGAQVFANGSQNSDGSITANSVQVR